MTHETLVLPYDWTAEQAQAIAAFISDLSEILWTDPMLHKRMHPPYPRSWPGAVGQFLQVLSEAVWSRYGYDITMLRYARRVDTRQPLQLSFPFSDWDPDLPF